MEASDKLREIMQDAAGFTWSDSRPKLPEPFDQVLIHEGNMPDSPSTMHSQTAQIIDAVQYLSKELKTMDVDNAERYYRALLHRQQLDGHLIRLLREKAAREGKLDPPPLFMQEIMGGTPKRPKDPPIVLIGDRIRCSEHPDEICEITHLDMTTSCGQCQ